MIQPIITSKPLVRLRRALGLMAPSLCIAAASVLAQSDSTWRDHERALQLARKSADTAAYRAQLSALYGTFGSTPRIAARYAALAINAHDTALATRWIGALAAMGEEVDSGMLGQYETLAGAPAAAALRALRTDSTRVVGSPEVALHLTDVDMIAEDIAYDAKHKRFLVTSVRRGGVYAIDAGGTVTTIMKSGTGGSWGMFALAIDPHGTLWTTSAALPMSARYVPSDSGKSTLMRYDPRNYRVAEYAAPDSGAHALGDLTVAPGGAVYVSDGLGSGVYTLDAGHTALRVLVPPGALSSPQTPALSADGKTLFVPDYSIGIAAVDVASGALKWLAHSDSLALTGVDGMYRVGRDLIIVQNGGEPNRIVRLTLDASMRRVERATVLVRGPAARELSHATMARGSLYFIARSGWDRVADDGKMRLGTSGDAPVIMRIRLAP